MTHFLGKENTLSLTKVIENLDSAKEIGNWNIVIAVEISVTGAW